MYLCPINKVFMSTLINKVYRYVKTIIEIFIDRYSMRELFFFTQHSYLRNFHK